LSDVTSTEFIKEFRELNTIHRIQVPGVIIMSRVSGSRCFNLHVEKSDWDWSGVYIAPLHSIAGLYLKPLTESYSTDTPNVQFHEVRRFAELLHSGTPAAIESLFSEVMIHMTTPWMRLREIRERFVTKECVHKYVQYGQGQLKKYLASKSVHTTGGKPGEKWLYHVLRLAKQAVKLAEGELPNNWLTGEEREEILMIRRKEVSEEETITKARKLFDRAKELLPDLKRPEVADTKTLHQWVLDTRGVV
jgi:predicted nucleotidyltransferase